MNQEITINVQADALPALLQYLAEHHLDRLTLVADRNTDGALGQRVSTALAGQGWDLQRIVLQDDEIVPDERAIVHVLAATDGQRRTYLAAGSGVVTDIVRFVSHRTGTDFIALPTAPSVDGYTSISASLVLNRLKQSINAHPPRAIFGDLDTLRAAPPPMVAAGFGDILAKYTSIADWRLGHLLWDTPFDEAVAQRTHRARDGCVAQVKAIGLRTPAGIQALFDALLETGLCMLAVGASYPAGGSEHYLSHYWEMKLLQEGRPAILHGAKVGVATILVAGLYARVAAMNQEEAAARLRATPMPDPDRDAQQILAHFWELGEAIVAEQAPFLQMPATAYRQLQARILDHWPELRAVAASVPLPQDLAGWLQVAGGPTHTRQLGLSDQERELALSLSHFLRNRFSVFKLGRMLGIIA